MAGWRATVPGPAAGAAAPPVQAPAAAPLAPAPGLADLDRLVAGTAGAGIRVEVLRTGPARAIPAGIDLSAFRIVQEALTNVVKHSGADRCLVRIAHGAGQLCVEITDPGQRPVPAPAAGARAVAMAAAPAPAVAALPPPRWPGPAAAAPVPGSRPAGTASRGCVSGSACAAASSPPGRCPGGASGSPPGSRCRAGRDEAAAGGSAATGRAAVTLRVVVADDQALVRAGFCGIVGATEGFTVVGEASTGTEAVAEARRARPDVVLMDVRMPVMDGIEATRQITGPDGADGARVLILTTFDLDEYVYSALRAGASGFLLKSTQPADLIAAIKVVAAGDALLAPSVTRRLVAEFVRRPAPPAPASQAPAAMAAITAREREVLALIATGMSNTEIAGRLAISAATTKTHVSHLLAKLNARDRVHLVILAYQAGLGPPG